MTELQRLFHSNDIVGTKKFLDETYNTYRQFLFMLYEKSSLDLYEKDFLKTLENSKLSLTDEEQILLDKVKIMKYLKSNNILIKG